MPPRAAIGTVQLQQTHLCDLVNDTLPEILGAPRAVLDSKRHHFCNALLACVECAQELEKLETGLEGIERHGGLVGNKEARTKQ